jgi:hypothetical protein
MSSHRTHRWTRGGAPSSCARHGAHDSSLGAVMSPLRRTDAERETVSVACDEKLPLPNARRKQHRS